MLKAIILIIYPLIIFIINLFLTKKNIIPNYSGDDHQKFFEKDNIQLSVNSANSGEGNEVIKADFNSDKLNISFNSKYLIDIASEVEDKKLKLNLKDSVSPVLIEDTSDKNSYYVIMPMKI